ncbi:multidrug effflux MFS transporter [Microbulbifer thermotolerans]|uniref:Bcr/CflA family efflux transporter n=1 Tax=Microbulbifer thermotolerans TaxID=252514 RepID=A0AB35I059_MICTH|nr:multidrug effflux MFS transporter [Microbulbifer thermotolerans]MCX2783718.1 multidrug effflux MFS transporter [Microbulbifer thermotolerans]MCX2795360.1 multidrug effflux MFS transporter [Microbulbifer thermotolerans]MCX2802432.1 multidrug effflux MFS transporter [Microbulbifer thermotolerans]MCX2832357.1 multidrug effflux MFS transporter [Microbulbifer thermotolerans]MCX2836045.1 multidrug effflux MFS transporter [Microbulbifer thermotolerans]
MPRIQLAFLLGMTVALGPLALDAYLPAFPEIADELGVAHGAVGLTLGAYVGTMGLAQLIGGPLSDRYGRQKILMLGLAIFALGAWLVAQAGTLQEMLHWRILQGIGGAFCAVSVPAVVRDQTGGAESARLFGLIGLIMFVVPALAPTLGAILLEWKDWPAIFLVLSGYAVVLMVVLHFGLFRRLPPRKPVVTPMVTLVTNYAMVLRHLVTMRFIGIQALCFSIMLVFITHSSFIYQEWFGLSKSMFSGLFAANIAAMAGMNLLNRKLLRSFDSVVILRAVIVLQGVMVLALVMAAFFEAPYWLVAVCIICCVGFQGAIVPNNMANALEFFPHLGGTAAALLGATQFVIAGLISSFSSSVSGHALLPIALTMAACSAGAVFLVLGAPEAVAREIRAVQATSKPEV